MIKNVEKQNNLNQRILIKNMLISSEASINIFKSDLKLKILYGNDYDDDDDGKPSILMMFNFFLLLIK